ncbi:aldo/keto reductase [bacterium]|nr:aldo/keto reductase [bacterium]
MGTDRSIQFTRRDFIKLTLAGALAATTTGCLWGESESAVASATDFVLPRAKVGATGIETTILGMGTGTNGFGGSSVQVRLGQGLVDLLEYGYDRGVRFFEAADQYGSHGLVSKALKSGGGTIDRDEIMLMTKINMDRDWRGRVSGDPNIADDIYVRQCVERFLRELGTDHLDTVLLHHVGIGDVRGDWNVQCRGAMDELAKMKEEGLIRSHGTSCHGFHELKVAAEEPWVDVDLARINPWGHNMDTRNVSAVKDVLTSMKASGKGVIGMKIFAAGLQQIPGDSTEAKRHLGLLSATESPFLDIFTIGFESRTQFDEVMSVLNELMAVNA